MIAFYRDASQGAPVEAGSERQPDDWRRKLTRRRRQGSHGSRLRDTGLSLRFLCLHGDKTLIAARMQSRSGHYMPASLLDSQFDTLEMPAGEADVVMLAIDQSPPALLRDALAVCA